MLDKLKSLSKQTLIYGTSTIVGRFLNFILVPFYTNVFPPSEYGVVAVIFAYMAFLNIFFSLGFESGYFRFASSLEFGDERQNFSHPFFTIAVNSVVLSAIIILLNRYIANIVGLKSGEIIIYSAIILFLDAIAMVPFAYLRLKDKAKIFAKIKIINICVNVGLNFLLIFVFKMGLAAVFISNLAASALTFLMLLPYIFPNLSFTYDKKLFRELAKFSLPYLPAGVAAMIVQVIDKPVTQYLTNINTVGIYNANYKLGIFMMLVVSMFDYAWRPFFMNNARESDAKPLFAKVLTIFTGAASLIFIILTLFIDDIIKIPLPFKGTIIGERYWAGVYIVPVVLFSYIFLGIYINLMSGIYIEKKTKYLPYITGLGAILNIVFCFALIPRIGIMGGAIATLASYFSMAVYIYFVSQKFYPVKYEISKILSLILLNIIVLSLYYFGYNGIIPFNFVVKILLAVIFVIGVVLLSGLSKVGKVFK